jgi:hypothetical protein
MFHEVLWNKIMTNSVFSILRFPIKLGMTSECKVSIWHMFFYTGIPGLSFPDVLDI